MKHTMRKSVVLGAFFLTACIGQSFFPFNVPGIDATSSPISQENIFFVDGNDGSDSYLGTHDRPWRTIQKAAEMVEAGDTVIVMAGEYPERVDITRSGEEGKSITFMANDTVIMQGFTIEADYISIIGFEITNTPDDFKDGRGIFVQGNHCILENNYIHFATRGGITLFAEPGNPSQTTQCTVRNNRLYRNGHYGLFVNGQDHLIESNEIWGTIQYHPNRENPPSTADADGVRFFGSGHIFRSNYIHDISLSDPYNVDPHIDAFQTWDGADVNVAHDILFEKNIIALHDGAVGWQTEGAVHNLTIRNNIVEAWDAGIRGHSRTTPPDNWLIVNNSFIGKLGISQIGVTIKPGLNITFKNNMILEQTRKTLSIIGEGISVSHNLASNSNGSMPPAPNTPSPDSLWGVNPLFASPGSGDFHLLAGSPAIDSGTSLQYVEDDFDGTARPQGTNFDIGPFEYSE